MSVLTSLSSFPAFGISGFSTKPCWQATITPVNSFLLSHGHLYGCTWTAVGSHSSFPLFSWPFSFMVKSRSLLPHQVLTAKTFTWKFKAKVCLQQYPCLMTLKQRVLLGNDFSVQSDCSWSPRFPFTMPIQGWLFPSVDQGQSDSAAHQVSWWRQVSGWLAQTLHLPASHRSIFHKGTEVLMRGWLECLLRSNHLAYKCTSSSTTRR